MRACETKDTHISMLEAQISMLKKNDIPLMFPEIEKTMNRYKALEDIYKCLREDYLPFLLKHNRGKELATMVQIIGK